MRIPTIFFVCLFSCWPLCAQTPQNSQTPKNRQTPQSKFDEQFEQFLDPQVKADANAEKVLDSNVEESYEYTKDLSLGQVFDKSMEGTGEIFHNIATKNAGTFLGDSAAVAGKVAPHVPSLFSVPGAAVDATITVGKYAGKSVGSDFLVSTLPALQGPIGVVVDTVFSSEHTAPPPMDTVGPNPSINWSGFYNNLVSPFGLPSSYITPAPSRAPSLVRPGPVRPAPYVGCHGLTGEALQACLCGCK